MPVLLQITENLAENLKAKIQALRLEKKAETLLSALGVSSSELSILVCDDTEIQTLNAEYRGKDRPTDVLSFPMEDEEQEETPLLGDVVISAETAEQQAGDLGASFADEVSRLLSHGLLHLLGYDHEDVPPEEVQRMEKKEQELFELICDS